MPEQDQNTGTDWSEDAPNAAAPAKQPEPVDTRTIAEIDDLTRAFKAMMSIHENSLEGAETTEPIEAPDLKLGDLEALRGVVKFPVRIKCATLAWNTLAQGIDEASA